MSENKEDWVFVRGGSHYGDDLAGSGNKYTLAEAKEHADRVNAAAFTQLLADTSQQGDTDLDLQLVYYFHSEVAPEDKERSYDESGNKVIVDELKNLFWRELGEVYTGEVKKKSDRISLGSMGSASFNVGSMALQKIQT